ncbi:hypothetical protein [Haloarchaeobius sp. DFWS5]|uniref:hypothetical protein n=1 Tax=Haloarchaeobius sp. DFWS5 TaxID=3446114 RepID=UPI003EC0B856
MPPVSDEVFRVDVLRYSRDDDGTDDDRHRAVPAGEGDEHVREREMAAKRVSFSNRLIPYSLALGATSLLTSFAPSVGLPSWTGFVALLAIPALRWWIDESRGLREPVPDLVAEDVPVETARREFGAHLDDSVADRAVTEGEAVTATATMASPAEPASHSPTPSNSSTVPSKSAGESTTTSASERSTESSAPER